MSSRILTLLRDAAKSVVANWRNLVVAAPQVLAIWRADFSGTPPILVYQMGKVGSTTVYELLRQLHLPGPVYQVHVLSRAGIRRAQAFYRVVNAPRLMEHFIVTRALARKVERARDVRWKIITLVRDPIARDISGYFQHVETAHRSLAHEDGQVAVAHAAEFARELTQNFDAYDERTDFACTWFDSELKTVFGVDVYEHPFPHDKGYAILHGASADVLVIRTEDINRCFDAAIREFLQLGQPVPLPARRTNTAEDRRVVNAYRRVLDTLRLPEATCRRVYSSRHCRHFYREEEIQSFINRWAEGARRP